jgi:hypothetical protein
MNPLPTNLIELVREQRAILFLGAGAGHGAIHPQHLTIPKAIQLRDAISDRFLSGQLKDKSLSAVAEIAANESSLPELQSFVASVFLPYQPAAHHLLVPTFRWRNSNYESRSYRREIVPAGGKQSESCNIHQRHRSIR